MLAIDEVVGGRHVEIGDVDARGRVPDADEFVGLGIGKRLEQDALEDAEEDGIAADSGSERDNRDGGKQWSVREAAEDLL